MSSDADFDFDPVAANGAVVGARVALLNACIEANDEICGQVALAVLVGFASHGGLEPESIDRLRDLVTNAVGHPERSAPNAPAARERGEHGGWRSQAEAWEDARPPRGA